MAGGGITFRSEEREGEGTWVLLALEGAAILDCVGGGGVPSACRDSGLGMELAGLGMDPDPDPVIGLGMGMDPPPLAAAGLGMEPVVGLGMEPPPPAAADVAEVGW